VPLADASVLAIADRVWRRTSRVELHETAAGIDPGRREDDIDPAALLSSATLLALGCRRAQAKLVSMIPRPTLRGCLFLHGDLINRSSLDAMGRADHGKMSDAHIYCEIDSFGLDWTLLVVRHTPTCVAGTTVEPGFRSRYKLNTAPDGRNDGRTTETRRTKCRWSRACVGHLYFLETGTKSCEWDRRNESSLGHRKEK
jgi:hypothetical protein